MSTSINNGTVSTPAQNRGVSFNTKLTTPSFIKDSGGKSKIACPTARIPISVKGKTALEEDKVASERAPSSEKREKTAENKRSIWTTSTESKKSSKLQSKSAIPGPRRLSSSSDSSNLSCIRERSSSESSTSEFKLRRGSVVESKIPGITGQAIGFSAKPSATSRKSSFFSHARKEKEAVQGLNKTTMDCKRTVHTTEEGASDHKGKIRSSEFERKLCATTESTHVAGSTENSAKVSIRNKLNDTRGESNIPQPECSNKSRRGTETTLNDNTVTDDNNNSSNSNNKNSNKNGRSGKEASESLSRGLSPTRNASEEIERDFMQKIPRPKTQGVSLARVDSFPKKKKISKGMDIDPDDPDTCWIGKGRGSNILKHRKGRAGESTRSSDDSVSVSSVESVYHKKIAKDSSSGKIPEPGLQEGKAVSTGQINREVSLKWELNNKIKERDLEWKKDGRKNATARALAVRSASPAGQIRVESPSPCDTSDTDQSVTPTMSPTPELSIADSESGLEQKDLKADNGPEIKKKAAAGVLGKRARRAGSSNILERAQSFEKKAAERESPTPRQVDLPKRVQNSIRSKFSELHDTSDDTIARPGSASNPKVPKTVATRMLRRADTQPRIYVSSAVVERCESDPQMDNMLRSQLGPKPTIAEQEAFIRNSSFPGTLKVSIDEDTSGDESSKSQVDENEKRSSTISPLAHDIEMWRKGASGYQTSRAEMRKTVTDLTSMGVDYRQLAKSSRDVRLPSEQNSTSVCSDMATETDTGNDDTCTIESDPDDSTRKDSTRSSITTEAELEETSTLSAFSQDEQDIPSQSKNESQARLTNTVSLGIRRPGSPNKKRDKSSMSSVIYAKRIQQWAERERDQNRTQDKPQKELFQVYSQVKTSRSSESDKDNAQHNTGPLVKEVEGRPDTNTMSSRILNQRHTHKCLNANVTIRCGDQQVGEKTPAISSLAPCREHNEGELTGSGNSQPMSEGFQRSKVYFQTGKALHRTSELETKRSLLNEKVIATASSENVKREERRREGYPTADTDGSTRSGEAKSWHTDSDTDASTGEEQLETDSSVCNVVEERRRRRLVKRTKKRVNRYKRREDYHSIGSASDESGAVSRASSLDRYDNAEDLDTTGAGKQYRGITSVNRKFSYPLYSTPRAPSFTGRGLTSSLHQQAMKSASTSTFTKSLVSPCSSFDMGSRSDQEGRDGRLASIGKLGGFSSVSKVAKVTIPSIKSFQRTRNFTPPSHGPKRVLSDSESYISTSMSEIKDFSSCTRQEGEILASPFQFRKYRGFGERYSDDEHEMTARLERFEELSEGRNLQRCNTLPRNLAGKYKVTVNPFKLNLPGRNRSDRDNFGQVENRPGKVDTQGFASNPFSLRQSEGMLASLHQKHQENTSGSTNSDQGQENQITSDVQRNGVQHLLKTGEDSPESSPLTDFPSNVMNQTVREFNLEPNVDVLATSPSTGKLSPLKTDHGFPVRSSGKADDDSSLGEGAVINDTFIPVIEPPDSFKDTPCRDRKLVFPVVSLARDGNDNTVYTDPPTSTEGDSLAQQISTFLSNIENEVGICYDSKVESDPTPSSHGNGTLDVVPQTIVSLVGAEDEEVDTEYPFTRRGTESPRRRPSYIKAQDSILPDMIDLGGDLPGVVPPPPTMYENLLLGEELSNHATTGYDEDHKTADEKLGRRGSKRARPRIPLLLDPVSSAGNEFATQEEKEISDRVDSKRAGRKEDGGSDSDELPSLDLSKVEKMESIKKRSRPVLAVTPILEGIPEEKGGDAVRGPKNDERVESHNHRKSRKSKKQNVQSPTSLMDEALSEGMDERVDSPKNDRDDKSETGYYSQSSDLLSTPSQLSIDDMSQDGNEFQDLQFLKTKGFRKNRTLDPYKDSDKNGDAVRSKSDPLPDGLSSDETKRINETISDIEMYSNSEPNLVPREKTIKESARRAVSNQEVVSRESPKSARKERDRKGSGDSAVDTLSPTNESVSFDSAFESVNSKSQLNLDEIAQVPAEVAVPSKPKNKEKPDMRRHVLQNLLETEKSYVQNLNYVVTMVYKPLKKPESASVIEPQLVDEIFFQIPEILVNHEFFLEQLTNRVNNWHERQVIGDIFISSFRKCLLMDAYSTFISHYLQARAAVRQATQARPSFGKFLEQCTKDHKEKLTLQDLMIMPVQRIPRYTLILKDMLKHTDVDHPDYGNLQIAIGEIKTLAERMNKGEMEADQAEREAERLRDIEATIEGVADLVATNRKFIRQDLVAEVRGVITKKDRCLFLFSDLLLCATVKRKTTALRRGSLGLFSGQSATDFNKYKLLWKLPLEDIELVKSSGASSINRRGSSDKQMEKLEEDLSILGNVSALADSLTTPHQNLDICIRELMADLNKQISERSQIAQAQPPPMTRVELQVQTDDGVEFFLFVFLSIDIKSSWEAYFEDAKQKLAYCRDTFPPEFQYSMPITKTRSGMQFTCAAPSHLNSHGELFYDQSRGDVWVCNSDGYVGQVCLLAVVPKAEPKAVLSVCSARIQCISPVPGARLVSSTRSPRTSFDARKLPQIPEQVGIPKKTKLSGKLSSPTPRIRKSLPSESEEDDQPTGPETIIAFDSSDDEDGDVGTGFIGGSTVFGGRMSPDGSSLGTAESMEGEHDSSGPENHSDFGGNDSSEDDDQGQQESSRRISMPIGSAVRRGSHGYTLKGSLDDLLGADIDEQPTMWLGTEDGSIYVYQANEAATARKSKMKMQLGAAVNAILYVDNKVFVALASGELCIYKRDAGSGWEVATPQTVQVGTTGTPITCIAAVAGRIWCGCQNNVILVNAATLKVEKTLTVSSDPHRSVYKIAGSGLGVWVSLQSSAVIRLYHATTLENLTDIDVAPAVHKMLAGADAIIRQHKAACLRVTALLTCKDQLWIGTSAGVILTNPLPPITMNTQSLRHNPGPSGSPHGHTGHVRFLTSVEVPKSQYKPLETNGVDSSSQSSTSPGGKAKQRDSKARQTEHDNGKTVTLVISGGDGYEDFRSNAASEAVGRDDSTNHLLIWRV